MLLDDDVVTYGQAESGSFTGGFGREERIEHLLLHIGRDTGAVITNPDFDTVAKVLGRGSERWLAVASIQLGFALCGRLEAV